MMTRSDSIHLSKSTETAPFSLSEKREWMWERDDTHVWKSPGKGRINVRPGQRTYVTGLTPVFY